MRQGNPTRDDPISDGDNHIRMIKDVLKNTFPEADGPQAKVVDPQLAAGSDHYHNQTGAMASRRPTVTIDRRTATSTAADYPYAAATC